MSRQNNKCKTQEENNMCRKLVVTNEIFLGARPICYRRLLLSLLDDRKRRTPCSHKIRKNEGKIFKRVQESLIL